MLLILVKENMTKIILKKLINILCLKMIKININLGYHKYQFFKSIISLMMS